MKNAKKGKKGGAIPGEEEIVVDETNPPVEEKRDLIEKEVGFNQKRAPDWVQAPTKEEISEIEEIDGGRKKKGNGHKATCGCPICKNMRKSKKGGARKSARKSKSRGRSSGRSRRRSQRRTQKRN